MAETVSLCLSYITESSNESLKSFDSGLTAADDAINLLKANTTNGSIEAADVSSLTYCSPVRWIEILSSVYMDKQDQSTNMDMKPVARETKKARSVTSSHTVERGESSGTHASIVKSTEAAGKVNSNRKVDVGQRSDQTHRQEGFYGDLGTGDDIELEIMIKRAFRLSVTDGLQEFTRFTVAETQYMNKGKEPIRPTVTETSSFAACISRNKEGNVQSNNNNRRPLRSALKKDSISLTRLTAKRQSSTQSTESDQSAAKTVVQFHSHEGNSQARLHKSENKRTEIDGSWKSNHNQSDDGNSQDTTSDEENQDYNNGELREQLDIIVKRNPSSAITVRPYTNTMTGQEVFLFNHGIVIPRKDTSKLIYGVAIPGKIFRQKKNRYSSTFTFLVALSKANLDILDIGTAKSDLIRTLILDDAEEAYRKSKYGDYTWVGITKERKHRYDPDTRSWLSLFYPSQWPRHGLVLSEGQNPPENSCKFRMISLCGKVLYQWYVRCELRKSFGPRNIIARLSCGEDGTCEKLLNWDPESGPMIHNDSVKRWTEIDPNREGVDLPDMFYPFMKFWIIEGPPREEPPPVRRLLEIQANIMEEIKIE
ncbi:hypothetical protein EYB26_008730 [Talaromyces marneffei]|uniref:uncharacterized protein n=1 Tax=Talaromyces marneffei TaxID=37727 RepID=UPI0012A8A96C|nr:uncharacterized protein EYB26_008730 [Talaromyces marneffei]QGA21020.1 hypothetical protein EYB26_008730 [Talaromyces marneffei]